MQMTKAIFEPLLCVGAIVIATVVMSCQPEKPKETSAQQVVPAKPQTIGSLTFSPRQQMTPETPLSVSVASSTDSVTIDSVVVRFNETTLASSQAVDVTVSLKNMPLGKQSLAALLFLNNGKVEQHNLDLTIFAAAPPQKYSYRKLATYTHDPDAYTQGLLYHNGLIYESTGTKGESTLRQVELSTGKVLKQTPLADQYFGEGLALWQNELIQLTWTSRIGFVYDLESFTQKRTFNYPTEGWGLASTSSELVMSDGSENLYFLDPYNLIETRRIQVYNDKNKVGNLNELEVVDGLIYANVYQTDSIVMIDPETGAVVGEVSLEDIFNRQGYARRLDVLNGIAWDASGRRLFVTGKWWPKLYQIELFKIQT